ncbi:penicillin-binding protein 1B [Desulfobacula toluolica]|uniref:Penicillin-binding protein 1B n=1 Tax=Desulfobacula toluolica (strain DSM 7467 / Tol2) TaxID=651182 RepID=K0NSW8_DESTT|nr:penicillin-binding protein 1B [Desulfobacula toluolica]CCK82092.1 PbpB: penicillin-binding protein 1B [Desulfobacula toluolica Tol2]
MKKWYLISAVCLLGLGIIFYDHFLKFNTVVEEKFQGRLWELPARVYARPLELYPGMRLAPDLFEKELNLMGYQNTGNMSGLDAPGKYVRTANRFELFCRPFNFGDEQMPERRFYIKIENNRVVNLQTSPDRTDKTMERLDPVIVGGFYPSSMEDRILVTLDQTPPLLGNAIICVEDKTFYSHYGIDPKSIFRAMLINLKNRRMSQGASTITQQLARNFFLTKEKTLIRKFNEMIMAAALELNYSKADILEAYINEVYLGQDGNRAIHGFGLAAYFYFGKSLTDLRPHEIALLVGMLKGPSVYNPRRYPDRAMDRRNLILEMMEKQGLVSQALLKKFLAAPLDIIENPVRGHSPFPFYLDLVKRQLLQEYKEADLKTMGIRIFTTLDPQVQLAAEHSVTDFLKQAPAGLEAGVVVTARASNEVQALVGGKDFRYKGFNRALDAKRPIGSLVKPAVFLTALERPSTYTLVTPVDDNPVRVPNPDGSYWSPENFDKTHHGQVKLYQALVHSFNVPTVRLGMNLGVESVLDTLEKMGLDHKPAAFPSVLLGSLEMSPLQVAQTYQTLASGGFFTPIKCIRSIYRPDGQVLQRYPLTIEQRLDPGAVFLLNKMLQAVVKEGTGKSLKKWVSDDLGIAGKTGTTNDLKDSWFAGFSGNRLAVVWIGRDDNRSAGLTGSSGALQIFGRLMSRIPNAPLDLQAPGNVEWAVIDAQTGYLTQKTCPDAMAVPFLKGSTPTRLHSCTSKAKTRYNDQETKKKPNILMDWLKEIFK